MLRDHQDADLDLATGERRALVEKVPDLLQVPAATVGEWIHTL